MKISFGASPTLPHMRPCLFAPLQLSPPPFPRLLDIVHADQKLYLVFEFLDVDLKRYIETGNQNRTPITLQIVKVSLITHSTLSSRYTPNGACKNASR